MSMGLGAMIHYLGGGSENSADKYYGRKITAASKTTNDRLALTFEDGVTIEIWDNGQSCCEARWMTTDDDPQSLVGHTLTRIDCKEGPTTTSEYGEEHESVFIEVGTDTGFITVCTHNEHNGYYGGFGLTITEKGP